MNDLLIVDFLEYFLENNNIEAIKKTIIVIMISLLLIYGIKYLIKKILEKKLSQFTTKIELIEEKIDNILRFFNFFDYLFIPLAVILSLLKFPEMATKYIDMLVLAVTLFYTIRITEVILEYLFAKYNILQTKKNKNYNPQANRFVLIIIETILWISAILFYISNIGFNISTLVTGLGLGGIIIAFSLQSILADIFAYISILIDKPFVNGDFIYFGNERGTIENIGIKTTRVRHLNGELLSVPNKILIESNIHNYAKLKKRRINEKLNIEYSTPTEKIEKGIEIIKKVVSKYELAIFDRANFIKFDEFALLYEFVYFVNSPEYKDYLDLHEKILLDIKREFKKEKINFAFPTQSIMLKNLK